MTTQDLPNNELAYQHTSDGVDWIRGQVGHGECIVFVELSGPRKWKIYIKGRDLLAKYVSGTHHEACKEAVRLHKLVLAEHNVKSKHKATLESIDQFFAEVVN